MEAMRLKAKPCSWCNKYRELKDYTLRMWQSIEWPDVIHCANCKPPHNPEMVIFFDVERPKVESCQSAH